MTLSESVAAAATTLTAETTATPVTVDEPATTTTTTEVPTTESSTADNILEVDATAEEIQNALEIRKTLANPATAAAYIKQLATSAGIAITETKADVTPKQATSTIISILEKHLGSDNADLAKILAPALEELIANEVKQPLQQLSVDQQIQQVKAEVETAFDKLNKELPDFAKLQNEMDNLSNQVSPGPKSTIESYMRQLYKLAGGAPAKDSTSKTPTTSAKTPSSVTKVITKMINNAKETKTNVSGDVDETRVKSGSHRPTLREAVLSAAQTLNGQRD